MRDARCEYTVDQSFAQPPHEQRGHEPAILSDLGDRLVRRAGEKHGACDAVDLIGLPDPTEQFGVELALPVTETRATARADNAATVPSDTRVTSHAFI